MIKAKFVERSVGSFKADDGRTVEYDSIIVSDGIRTHKLPSKGVPLEETNVLVREVDTVEIEFTLGPKGLTVAHVKKAK